MIDQATEIFNAQPVWAQSLLAFLALGMFALLVNFVIKRVILRLLEPFLDTKTTTSDRAAFRLATVVPLLIVANGVELVPHLYPAVRIVVHNVAMALVIISIAAALSKGLDYVNEVYNRRPEARNKPIKGYIQVLKIAIYCAATILAIAALIEESPLLLLSGLGAMAAVLLLVFKDTILSLVASVQLSSNDMLRVGDWIEMPSMGADGDVIDIALHTVKVQNFDKTITTIPTHKLISESYRNWRGMREAGGRRIKRALPIDQNAIRFMTDEEVSDMRRFRLLRDYLDRKDAELAEWNAREAAGEENRVNARRYTNIGLLRAYIIAYLKAHKRLTGKMTLLVRQLPPTPQGLPLEVYCFTGTTQWMDYESVQSDLFDHLIAILPEFGLRLFQEPSGLDMATIGKACDTRD